MSVDHEQFYKAHAELFTPTPEEWAAHRNIEELSNFKLIEKPGISEGRQSRVSILEYESGREQQQVIWKRMAAGKNLTEEEASRMDAMLLPYRQELVEQGWNVPETFFHTPVKINGETQIFSYDQFIPGGDGENTAADPDVPNFRKWFIVRKVAETLAGYDDSKLRRQKITGQELTALPHGLDLKLANVVADPEGKVFFVDLFGPKQLDENGDWIEHNPKLDSLSPQALKAVCATREGSLLRFYRLARDLWSEASGVSRDHLDGTFSTILRQIRLPSEEMLFIERQIESDFAWLDSVYAERSV